MPKSNNLSITLGPGQSNYHNKKQPLSPRSPRSPGRSGNIDEIGTGLYTPSTGENTPVANFPLPPESPASPQHRKDSSRSIFSLSKASKSSSRLNSSTNDASARHITENGPASSVYPYGRAVGSSPSLGYDRENDSGSSVTPPSHSNTGSFDHRSGTSDSVATPGTPVNSDGSKRSQTKSRFHLLARTRSTSARHGEDSGKPKESAKLKSKNPTPRKTQEKEKQKDKDQGRDSDRDRENDQRERMGDRDDRDKDSDRERVEGEQEHRPNKSATEARPIPTDQKDKIPRHRAVMGSTVRSRSTDAAATMNAEDDEHSRMRERKDHFFSSSFKDNGSSSNFFNNFRSQGSKAADGLGKVAKGLAGKIARSGSSHEREMIVPENWVPKVIHLPLVEQTRVTRISQRLEDCKDKTEFWMPALPWRCIDYLNMKGCEEEGLYRVPGSGKEIKHWQMRFDNERDINLFDEPELYDINIIGSMFKAWLRDLPDEIFPKATQARISEQCAGAKTTPQVLKDELSKLPPFNYYLLFAITCHISLLHSCSEMNKMDYRNLCICFQPCMKIDAFCFQFLVLDWRNCWQGCWTEKEYLAEEMRVREQKLKDAAPIRNAPATLIKTSANGLKDRKRDNSQSSRHRERSIDRAISSSGSSKPSVASSLSDSTTIGGTSTPDRGRPRLPPLEPLKPEKHRDFKDGESVITPTQAEHNLGPRVGKDTPPSLSPMKPLSPMSL